jgi:small-conductance mechanosensitive channel
MESILRLLQYPLATLGESSITLGKLLTVATLLLLGGLLVIWSARFLRKRLALRRVNADLAQLLSRAYLVLAFVMLAFIALDFLNIPLAAFAFISGAVAIGVGFGAQNIINNFISGWILMWERPIKLGDFLELGEVRGTVESINTRSTCIRRVDGVHLLVPNSYLLENTVTNWTLLDKLVRTSVRLGVSYRSDIQLVTTLLEKAAEEHPDVLNEPAHAVIFDDFGNDALIFEINVWVHATSDRDIRLIRSDLRYKIDELFRENAVVIAFPQRDVHVDGQIMLQQVSGT